MNYLITEYEHYNKFVEKYGTDRLQKGLKLYTNSKSGLLFKTNEIFEKELYTNYIIEKLIPNLLISFNTTSGYKYRLDIFRVNEELKSKGYINHIAFSDYNKEPTDEDYEDLLNRNEVLEIISRIHFIIKDLIKDDVINNYFCIGGTKLLAKNNIYKYVLKILVGEDGVNKLDTNVYDTGYGLYFKI